MTQFTMLTRRAGAVDAAVVAAVLSSFEGSCHGCGVHGHRKADCPRAAPPSGQSPPGARSALRGGGGASERAGAGRQLSSAPLFAHSNGARSARVQELVRSNPGAPPTRDRGDGGRLPPRQDSGGWVRGSAVCGDGGVAELGIALPSRWLSQGIGVLDLYAGISARTNKDLSRGAKLSLHERLTSIVEGSWHIGICA